MFTIATVQSRISAEYWPYSALLPRPSVLIACGAGAPILTLSECPYTRSGVLVGGGLRPPLPPVLYGAQIPPGANQAGYTEFRLGSGALIRCLRGLRSLFL